MIKIKMMDGSCIELDVDHTMKVSKLKEILYEKINVETTRQRLIYTGKVLVDDQSLESYSITDGDALHLVVRPSNIPPSAPSAAPAPASAHTRPSQQSSQASPIHFENLGNGVIMGTMTVMSDGDWTTPETDINEIVSHISNMVTSLNSSRTSENDSTFPATSSENEENTRSVINTNTATTTTSADIITIPQNYVEGIRITDAFQPSLESSLSSIEALVRNSQNNTSPTDLFEGR
jgi:uncharacterized ubiquitin-like protein YukD